MSQELIVAAYDYLSRGLAVIALSGKMPNGRVHQHGLHDAIENGASIIAVTEAFNHPATTGIGILTRYPYFVVDIDGEGGAEEWKRIAGGDYMPSSWVASTGRGLHLWFANEVPRRTRKLGPLLDLKAEGGYVAAPPSQHFAADTGKPDAKYEWMLGPGDGDPMEAPRVLVALLDEQDALREQALITRDHRTHVRHEQGEDGRWWAGWGFEGLLKAMRDGKEGERNALLYWCTMTMVQDDASEEDYEQLKEAALGAGLTSRETRLTMRSAQRAAANG